MRVAFVEGVDGGTGDGGQAGPDGTIGAEVDLAVATPEYDVLAALSREQIEQILFIEGSWLTGELSYE